LIKDIIHNAVKHVCAPIAIKLVTMWNNFWNRMCIAHSKSSHLWPSLHQAQQKFAEDCSVYFQGMINRTCFVCIM